MSKVFVPENYHSQLNLIETEVAIKMIKDYFERRLSEELRLTRVSAPLFLLKNTGLNDDLNGTERPVAFNSYELNNDDEIEIIHSLAKWKRDALYRYGFEAHTGLYTDMNAIRRDETIDNLHSMYVDQWDWELVIKPEDRTVDFFKQTVKKIYKALLDLDFLMIRHYPKLDKGLLPEKIFFITTQELEDVYPDLTPKERERAITKAKKAVCLMKIGDTLKSGIKHDGRAPDYDDWTLNGDILVYHPILDDAFELSSMGVRVDAKALEEQLKKAHAEERTELPYHQNVLNNVYPLSIGGGIGQSRLCMFFLKKAHIGEVQASLWDEDTMRICEENDITKPYVLHAEANAITKLARSSNNSDGSTLYVTASPCIECAKLIIQAGIKRVVYAEKYRLNDGIQLMERAGIKVEFLDIDKQNAQAEAKE